MRLSSIVLSLACAFGLVSAASINNPFTFAPAPATIEECGSPDDILKLINYSLNPNPPLKGEVLVIDAEGELSEDVVEGAKINLIVK